MGSFQVVFGPSLVTNVRHLATPKIRRLFRPLLKGSPVWTKRGSPHRNASVWDPLRCGQKCGHKPLQYPLVHTPHRILHVFCTCRKITLKVVHFVTPTCSTHANFFQLGLEPSVSRVECVDAPLFRPIAGTLHTVPHPFDLADLADLDPPTPPTPPTSPTPTSRSPRRGAEVADLAARRQRRLTPSTGSCTKTLAPLG